MTLREKIIKRLNKTCGYDIPLDTKWTCRQRKYRSAGGFSWCLLDIAGTGSCEPASEVLKWKRWVISKDGEIFEWCPQYVHCDGDTIEEIQKR